MQVGDIVHVTWRDSSSLHGWDTRTTKQKTIDECSLRCQTVGYVVHVHQKMVSLAASIGNCEGDSMGLIHDTIIIPREAIVRTELLRKKEARHG